MISPGKVWRNEASVWSVVWVDQGEGEGVFDPSGRAGLKPGAVFVAPPGSVVSICVRTKAPLVGHALTFGLSHLPCTVTAGTKVLLQHASNGRPAPAVLTSDCRLRPLLEGMASDARRAHAPPSYDSATSVLHSCPCPLFGRLNSIIEELSHLVNGSAQANGDIGTRVRGILSRMSQEELQAITIDDLAARCGCSRRHLSRLLRQQCGDSLSSIVNGARLDRSADLLREPNRKIADVAADCGFNHLGVFSRRFRDRFGATPAAWRKQQMVALELPTQPNSAHSVSRPLRGRSSRG